MHTAHSAQTAQCALLSFAVGICSREYLWDVIASQCATVVDDKHGLSWGKRKSSHLHFFSLENSSDLTSDLPLHGRPELEPKLKHR